MTEQDHGGRGGYLDCRWEWQSEKRMNDMDMRVKGDLNDLEFKGVDKLMIYPLIDILGI